MDVKTWTDEELASVRGKLDAWCRQRAARNWGNRAWFLTGMLGAFTFFDGIFGLYFDGIDPKNLFNSATLINFASILLGGAIAYLWYRSDKQRTKNIKFLAVLDGEIARRAASKPKVKKSKSKIESAAVDAVQSGESPADAQQSDATAG